MAHDSLCYKHVHFPLEPMRALYLLNKCETLAGKVQQPPAGALRVISQGVISFVVLERTVECILWSCPKMLEQ